MIILAQTEEVSSRDGDSIMQLRMSTFVGEQFVQQVIVNSWEPARYQTLVSSSKYVALVGGQDPQTREALDIVQVFSTHNLEEPLNIGKPRLSLARYSPACVIYEDNLFVYGG